MKCYNKHPSMTPMTQSPIFELNSEVRGYFVNIEEIPLSFSLYISTTKLSKMKKTVMRQMWNRDILYINSIHFLHRCSRQSKSIENILSELIGLSIIVFD